MMQNYRVIATLGAGLLFSLLVSLAVTGQTSQSSSQGGAKPSEFVLPQKHESRLTPAEQRGQALYEYYCYLCHGKTGKADDFNSYSLTTPPAKFADAAFMAKLSDTQAKTVIKGGGPALGLAPQMPTWGGVLTEKQVDDILSFIRTLSKKTE
jgi:mono/diheme cytochrome c family protein